MSYNLDFDGLRRDICTLAAWMLSYEGANHLNGHDNLKMQIVKYHRIQTSSLLLSIAAQLRIVRDTTKDKQARC